MAKAKSKKITLEKALVPLEEQPYEVPENWCWIKLGVISSIISKGTTPKGGKSAYVDEGIDFLRVENINDDGTICHDDMMHVTEETHTGFLKRSILEENDILVSIAGTLGKTAIVKNDDLPLNTNQAVAFVRLKDNGEVSREYIRYAIDTPVIQNMLLSKTKVTAIPNLTLEIISECLIPFPPLAEQQRIVEQIESLFSKLDEAKEKAQEVIDGYEARMIKGDYKAWNPYRGWMPVILTPKMGRFMSSIPLHQSISSICEIYTSHENGIQFTLSAEINDLLNKSTDGFKTQFVFNTSRSEIYGILSTVRNKILDWALLLEESGIVGEGMTFTEEEKKKAQETQVINNYTNNFYSDVSDVEMKQG